MYTRNAISFFRSVLYFRPFDGCLAFGGRLKKIKQTAV
jgi:hypothetical protein